MRAMTLESEGQAAPATLPKMAYSVPETCKISGLGKSVIWAAIADGRLRTWRVGRRVLISPEFLREFLEAETVRRHHRSLEADKK